MRPKNNCLNCEKREVGCHSNCDVYKEFRRQLDEQNEDIHKKKKSQQVLSEFFIHKYDRIKRSNKEKK